MTLRIASGLALLALLAGGELSAQRPARKQDPQYVASGGTAPCTVSRIIDGDTFACEGGSRVRLLLVDTDERNQSVYADSAIALVQLLMPPGSLVRLEFDVQQLDRYNRVLAYVFTDSVFVNREIVRRGMGHVAVYPPNVGRVDELRAAADSARQEKLGIWRGSAFECTPADFRASKSHCHTRPLSFSSK
jgi:endonuclease YncB( thermonuclease family)